MAERVQIKDTSVTIDEPTMRQIMNYYKVGNHNVFAKYVRSLGFEHDD